MYIHVWAKEKDLHVLLYTCHSKFRKVTCVQSLRWNFQTSTKKRDNVLLHPSKDRWCSALSFNTISQNLQQVRITFNSLVTQVNKEDKVFWTQGGVPVHVQLVIKASCSSQKSFRLAQNKIFDSKRINYWLQFFCNLNSPKNFTCPLGELHVTTAFTSPTAKSTNPRLRVSDTTCTFFAY